MSKNKNKSWFSVWMEAIDKADKDTKPMAILFGWIFALTAHKDENSNDQE